MMAKTATAEDRRRLATCLRVITGREVGKIAYDDLSIGVNEGVEARDAGGAIFAVHGLFEIQAAIVEAERLSKLLPRNFFKRADILVAIQPAKYNLDDAPILSF